MLLGKKSWVGQFFESWLAQTIIFTWWAAAIASVVVAFPWCIKTMKVGFSSVDRDLEDAGRSMGASEWQVLRFITLPLA